MSFGGVRMKAGCPATTNDSPGRISSLTGLTGPAVSTVFTLTRASAVNSSIFRCHRCDGARTLAKVSFARSRVSVRSVARSSARLTITLGRAGRSPVGSTAPARTTATAEMRKQTVTTILPPPSLLIAAAHVEEGNNSLPEGLPGYRGGLQSDLICDINESHSAATMPRRLTAALVLIPNPAVRFPDSFPRRSLHHGRDETGNPARSERRGCHLFDAAAIGTKDGWQARLSAGGLALRGHRLVWR